MKTFGTKISINPKQLWLREILYQFLTTSKRYEEMEGKEWPDRPDVIYLSDVLSLNKSKLKVLLLKEWPDMRAGAMSHINRIEIILKSYIEDGRLSLHLNPNNKDHHAYEEQSIHDAYDKLLPIVTKFLMEKENDI